MTNPLKTLFAEDLALLLARVPLGAYFAMAGYSKVFTIGAKAFAEKNAAMWPTVLPAELGTVYLTALPFVELLAGLMLIFGLFGRLAGGLVFLMLLSIIIAVGTSANPDPNAFVAFFKDPATPNRPFHANFIFLGAALVVTVMGSGGFSVDRFLFRGAGKPAGGK